MATAALPRRHLAQRAREAFERLRADRTPPPAEAPPEDEAPGAGAPASATAPAALPAAPSTPAPTPAAPGERALVEHVTRTHARGRGGAVAVLGVDSIPAALRAQAGVVPAARDWPAALALRARGRRAARPISPTRLALRLLARAESHDWRVAIVGGSGEVLPSAVSWLQLRFPCIEVVAAAPAPRSERERRATVERLRRAKPDLVLLGLAPAAADPWTSSVACRRARSGSASARTSSPSSCSPSASAAGGCGGSASASSPWRPRRAGSSAPWPG